MLLIQFSPLLLIGVLWFVMIRQADRGNSPELWKIAGPAALYAEKNDHVKDVARRG